MSALTIWPVRMGIVPNSDKSGLTHGMNQSVMIDTAVIVCAIKGAKENIIVDSGMGNVKTRGTSKQCGHSRRTCLAIARVLKPNVSNKVSL